jgi:hypothetical protein
VLNARLKNIPFHLQFADLTIQFVHLSFGVR